MIAVQCLIEAGLRLKISCFRDWRQSHCRIIVWLKLQRLYIWNRLTDKSFNNWLCNNRFCGNWLSRYDSIESVDAIWCIVNGSSEPSASVNEYRPLTLSSFLISSRLFESPVYLSSTLYAKLYRGFGSYVSFTYSGGWLIPDTGLGKSADGWYSVEIGTAYTQPKKERHKIWRNLPNYFLNINHQTLWITM